MGKAADNLERGVESVKEKFGQAVSAATTAGNESQPVNARAVWEASHSDEQG